tara:strand:+ start:275 stop:793 length:519 start_codon:yes stop_codon:yes gene_type:complete
VIGIGVAVVSVVLSSIAQISIAPFFTIGGAILDFNLLAIIFIATYLSRKISIGALVLLSLLTGAITETPYEWVLLAYLPTIPLIYFIYLLRGETTHTFITVLATATVIGLWGRILMSVVAVSGGTSTSFGVVITQILAPGILLDMVLVIIFYGIYKMAGLNKQRLVNTGYNT